MKRFLELCKDFLKEWGGLRILLAQDRAQIEAEMSEAFSKAKRLSYFLGMIVQLTFLIIFTSYFFAKAHDATSGLWGYKYGMAGTFGVMFTGYFSFLISRVVFQYFMRDMAVHRNPWIKAIMFIVVLYFYWVAITSVYEIAQAIAHVTKLNQ